MIERFTTQRLCAERLCTAHFADLDGMHQDGRVMATLASSGGPLSPAESRARCERDLEHWREHGFGPWIFREADGGEFVGRAALWHREVEGESVIALGYAIRSDRWGEGFAAEMAEGVLDVGFGQLALSEIACFTLPTNAASLRVMEKLGFRPEREVLFAALPHRMGMPTAADWKRTRGSIRDV